MLWPCCGDPDSVLCRCPCPPCSDIAFTITDLSNGEEVTAYEPGALYTITVRTHGVHSLTSCVSHSLLTRTLIFAAWRPSSRPCVHPSAH